MTQDLWDFIHVGMGYSDSEPSRELLDKLIDIGNRIGLTWLGDDELTISYAMDQPIEQTRIVSAIRSGGEMLGVFIAYIELVRCDNRCDRDDDQFLVWRWNNPLDTLPERVK